MQFLAIQKAFHCERLFSGIPLLLLSAPHCSKSGLTTVRSKPSVAACVACMMPFMLGVCFLCPAMDCLWHKQHYCPNCGEKVADFEKSDPCAVVDVPHWIQESFALPA